LDRPKVQFPRFFYEGGLVAPSRLSNEIGLWYRSPHLGEPRYSVCANLHLFDHIGHGKDQRAFNHLARKRPLNASILALWVGFTIRLKSSVTPFVPVCDQALEEARCALSPAPSETSETGPKLAATSRETCV
jgi:hypothetical protein